MKFKETNQICSPLKISQSINAESSCDLENLTKVLPEVDFPFQSHTEGNEISEGSEC